MRSVLGCCCRKKLAQIGEGQPGVQNVLDHQHVLALDRLIQVLDQLDRARGALPIAIARCGHKVECRVHLDGPRQIGQKRRRALQHAHHHQLFAVQVTGNLRAHLGHALGNLLAGIENLKALVGSGSHASSIAAVKAAGRSRVLCKFASATAMPAAAVSPAHASILDRYAALSAHFFGLNVAHLRADAVAGRSCRRLCHGSQLSPRAHLHADAVGMVAIAVVARHHRRQALACSRHPLEFRSMGWSVLWDTAGFAWFGGLVFGISALVLQGWWAKIGALRTLDLAAPGRRHRLWHRAHRLLSSPETAATALPTNLPWGMSFPNGIEPTFVRVHPTPLYELAAGLAHRAWLYGGAAESPPGTGAILGEYLVLTGMAAFWSSSFAATPRFSGAFECPIGQRRLRDRGHRYLWWASTRPVTGSQKPALIEHIVA